MKIKWSILVTLIKAYHSLWTEGDGRGELSRKTGDTVGTTLGVTERGRWHALTGGLKFRKKILLSCKDLLANGEQSHSFNYFFLDFFLLLKMQVLGVYFIWLNISNAGLGGQHIHSLLLSYLKKQWTIIIKDMGGMYHVPRVLEVYLNEGLGGELTLLLKHVAQFHVLMFKVVYLFLKFYTFFSQGLSTKQTKSKLVV